MSGLSLDKALALESGVRDRLWHSARLCVLFGRIDVTAVTRVKRDGEAGVQDVCTKNQRVRHDGACNGFAIMYTYDEL